MAACVVWKLQRPCWTPGCRPRARIIERNSRVLCRQLDQEDGTIALAGGRHPRTAATSVQSVCKQPGRGEHTTESDTREHDRAIAILTSCPSLPPGPDVGLEGDTVATSAFSPAHVKTSAGFRLLQTRRAGQQQDHEPQGVGVHLAADGLCEGPGDAGPRC